MDHQRNLDMFLQYHADAYDTQEHRRTNPLPYSLVLSRQQTVLSPLAASVNVPDGSSGATSPQAMRAEIQIQIATLTSRSDAYTRKSQQRYKPNYDRYVRESPVFKPDDYVLVDITLPQAIVGNTSGVVSNQMYNKIQSRTVSLFKILTVEEKRRH